MCDIIELSKIKATTIDPVLGANMCKKTSIAYTAIIRISALPRISAHLE